MYSTCVCFSWPFGRPKKRPQKKTQKTPDQHAVADPETTKENSPCRARRPRARRASELLTNTTDPAHAATRKPGEHPQHAPHLDLSPIFPLKYKTKTKIPRANRGRDAPSGRDRITFSFWETWSCCCLRVDGVEAGRYGTVRGVVGGGRAGSWRRARGASFHYSTLRIGSPP